MKKLSKILALSTALALTFSMTAFAANSPAADANEWAEAAQGTTAKDANDNDVTVEVTPSDVAVVSAVEEAVKASEDNDLIKAVKAAAKFSKSTVDLAFVIDITPTDPISGEVEVKIPFGGAAASAKQKYVLMHQDGDNWVAVEGAKVEGGFVTFKTSSFSNYALFLVSDTYVAPQQPAPQQPAQPTAPQTGETVPVAGFVAMILLAGAAVCAKKAQFNN